MLETINAAAKPLAHLDGFGNAMNMAKGFGNVANNTAQLGQLGQMGGALSNVGGAASKLGGVVDKIGKFGDMANKVMAPVAAVGNVVGLGFDIYNTVQQQKQAKEQMDLAKKNMNLELEKAQKQEHAYNKLAASVDKAWGGDGKIENTIDYSQYKATGNTKGVDYGGGSLVAGGKSGEIQDPYENSRNADASASLASGNELGGSGNMPTMASGAPLQPVGYSESMPSNSGEEESA